MKIVITGHRGFIGTHLWEKLEGKHDLIGLDIKTGQDIRNCDLPDADVCFHLAAQTDARIESVTKDLEVNVLGSVRIFQKYGSKTIYTSSCAVNYPVTPYAISKLAAEKYALYYRVQVLRLCNIFGPGGHGVFERFMEDNPIQIAGDGTQLRTYAPVWDAVTGLTNLIPFTGSGMSKLDILRGEDMSINEVADRFPEKKRIRVEALPTDIHDGRQIY